VFVLVSGPVLIVVRARDRRAYLASDSDQLFVAVQVVTIAESIEQAGVWQSELDSLLLRLGERFQRRELRLRMHDYVRGLLGPVSRKNGWQLAEYAGHATSHGLQRLPAGSTWDADAMRDDVRDFVAKRLGEPNGVLIIDNTGFIKKGVTSAGVARQYTGASGKVDNCQIGVFAAYASCRGRALIDRELYPPKSWTDDPARCAAARIPADRGFTTKPALALAIPLSVAEIRRLLAALTAADHAQRPQRPGLVELAATAPGCCPTLPLPTPHTNARQRSRARNAINTSPPTSTNTEPLPEY
jgi:hypothetical protein